MAVKNDFSRYEWKILREAPHLVILAVTLADASGFFGTMAEAMAPSEAISKALNGENKLLQELCDKEEIQNSITAIKERARTTKDYPHVQEYLRKEALDTSRSAIELLSRKGTEDDLLAYKEFLIELGQNVALAAKEGDFLGFGGERISEHERIFLADLAKAVGALQA